MFDFIEEYKALTKDFCPAPNAKYQPKRSMVLKRKKRIKRKGRKKK
uniref:Uncharacterized protein n=1 Tax=Siphoviridae sp. ctc6d98 TaxID=2825569 RepID=A0A8S5PAZ7_9CAUD|nr:MAG TPA: hypothetical protein [Siphoviridae sp. ctc6d98]DAF03504.1 MAG TPA: hypothetical protein [Caudoviricetes sp.]